MTEHNPYQAPAADLETAQRQLADRGSRLAAAILDAIIMGAIAFPIILILSGGWKGYAQYAALHPLLMPLIGGALGLAAYLLVNGKLLSSNGQTIGKKALGIKIVRTNGELADLQWIILRRVLPVQVLSAIPFIGGLFGLVDVCFIFGDDRRCIHDKIADTVVIKA